MPHWYKLCAVRWSTIKLDDARRDLVEARHDLRMARRHGWRTAPYCEARVLFHLDFVWAMQEFVKTMEARI